MCPFRCLLTTLLEWLSDVFCQQKTRVESLVVGSKVMSLIFIFQVFLPDFKKHARMIETGSVEESRRIPGRDEILSFQQGKGCLKKECFEPAWQAQITQTR